jgi:hypothetical protein
MHHVIKPVRTISEHILKLHDDKDSGDVAIKVEDKVFYAHQYVLELRAADFVNGFCQLCDSMNPLIIKEYGFNAIKADAESWFIGSLKLTADSAIDELRYADNNNQQFPGAKDGYNGFHLEKWARYFSL